MSEDYGTAHKPLPVKCTSIGRPDRDCAYLCIVAADGRQFYFDVTFNMARLISVQAADAVAGWPAAPAKTS